MQRVGAKRVGAARKGATVVAAFLLAFCAFVVPASADDSAPDFRRWVTVKFDSGASAADRSAARRAVGAQYELSLDGPRLQQISVAQGSSAAAAADELTGNSDVEYAVASGTWRSDAFFDDQFLSKQWGLDNYGQSFLSRFLSGHFEELSGTPGVDIDAPQAWAAVDPDDLGSEKIGVVDTGVAYQHPDLAPNIVAGSDFYDSDSDPRDPNGHGTHVASVAAGAAGNGIGTAGVDPWAKVMPLRAADPFGNFSWAAIEQAVTYGLDNGVRVFNGSFGGPDNDPAFVEIMRDNPQALFVFSAGNGGSDGAGDNHDLASGSGHRYPCDTDLQNVICVGASDWTDALTRFSDFGVSSVDLLAPGANILAARPCVTPATSTADQGECPYDEDAPTAPVGLGGGPYAFQFLSGTSMAAPAVAGAAALVWGKCPNLQPSQVKTAILSTVDPVASVRTKVAWGGRLDLGGAIASVASCPPRSGGNDWPQPPAQPEDPGDDGGGGGGPAPTPTPDPVVPPSPIGLKFQVIKPSKARVGRSSYVSFKLKCSAACSAAAKTQVVGSGLSFKKSTVKLARGSAGTRAIKIKLSRAALKNVRALLAAKTKVRMKISLVVTDANGVSSSPLAFDIRLAR